jgi:hypothetical protein
MRDAVLLLLKYSMDICAKERNFEDNDSTCPWVTFLLTTTA